MTLASRMSRITGSIVAGLCAASCGRIGFDLLPSDSQQAVTTDGGAGGDRFDATAGAPGTGGTGPESGGTSGSGGTSTGGASDGGASSGGTSGAGGTGGSATGGASGTQSGGAGGASSGGASSGGVSNTGGVSPDAGPPPVCASASGTVKVWSFDSTVESWAYWPNLGAGTLSWTGATGNPAAGSLAADVTNGDGVLGWIVMDSAAPNLSGHTGSVWLYLDSGNVGIKMYAQAGSTYKWADGGFVTLTPKTWTCVTINFSTPVYNDAGYSPASVVRFGIELSGIGPLRIYADQFSY
jgi:hypothetical protein